MKSQQSGKSTVSNRAERDEVETLHLYGQDRRSAVCGVCRLKVWGVSGWIIWLTSAGMKEADRTKALTREPNNRDKK